MITMEKGPECLDEEKTVRPEEEDFLGELIRAYRRGYSDGYDRACMDLTDDDLGTVVEGLNDADPEDE